jgi:hypothetical protein
MKAIHLTDAELRMVRHAVHSYVTTFGHDEADVLTIAKSALGRIDAAIDEPGPSERSA